MTSPLTDTIYFTIQPDTPAMQVLKDWEESVKKHLKWVQKFAKEHFTAKHTHIGRGPAVFGFGPPDGQWSEQEEWWKNLDPKWRRERSSRGSDYAVPRNTGESKAVAKQWSNRPMPKDVGHIKAQLTGLNGWSDWMLGMTNHGIGWWMKDDGSAIVSIPYFVTRSKEFKPMEGMTMGKDQMKLREELLKEKS